MKEEGKEEENSKTAENVAAAVQPAIAAPGEELSLEVKAAPLPKLVPRTAGVDATPSYFVVGGLREHPDLRQELRSRDRRMLFYLKSRH